MLSSSEALAFYVHVFISCRILTVVVDTAPDAATYSEAIALQVHVFGSCTLTTCVADAWLAQLLHCCQAAGQQQLQHGQRQQRRQRRRQEEQMCVTGSKKTAATQLATPRINDQPSFYSATSKRRQQARLATQHGNRGGRGAGRREGKRHNTATAAS